MVCSIRVVENTWRGRCGSMSFCMFLAVAITSVIKMKGGSMSERLGSMYWMAICILSLLITTNAAAITIQSVRVIYNGDTDTPLFVKHGDHIEIVVTVKGADEKALVGATIIDPEGDELDLPFQYVHCAKNL